MKLKTGLVSQNNKNIKPIKIGAAIIIIIALFVLLNITGLTKNIRTGVYWFSSPGQTILWKFGQSVSRFFSAFGNINGLKMENKDLKKQLANLEAENGFLREVKKENDALREALGVGLRNDFKLTMASVISRDLSQDSVLVNKGSEQGISKGMAVITSGKYLVGRVVEIYGNFSKVMLISNKDSAFDAKVIEKDVLGLVKGQGNLKITLTLVPRDKEIKPGDKVLTIDKGGIFPAGIYVGEITEVLKSDTEAFQEAKIRSIADYDGLTSLFIVGKK